MQHSSQHNKLACITHKSAHIMLTLSTGDEFLCSRIRCQSIFCACLKCYISPNARIFSAIIYDAYYRYIRASGGPYTHTHTHIFNLLVKPPRIRQRYSCTTIFLISPNATPVVVLLLLVIFHMRWDHARAPADSHAYFWLVSVHPCRTDKIKHRCEHVICWRRCVYVRCISCISK